MERVDKFLAPSRPMKSDSGINGSSSGSFYDVLAVLREERLERWYLQTDLSDCFLSKPTAAVA